MPNICVFGDSVAFGASDEISGGWVNRLKVFCLNHMEDTTIYNLGICGDTTEDVLKRIDIEAEAREPQIIIFAIGINDSSHITTKEHPYVDENLFLENLSILFTKASKFTKSVIFIGLTPLDQSRTMPIPWDTTRYYDENNVKKYNTLLISFCDKHKLPFINVRDTLSIKDLSDGLHPNSKGHEKIFEKVKEFLLKHNLLK